MSTLTCRCGRRISDSLYPSPTEGSLTRQYEHDRFSRECEKKIGEYLAAARDGRAKEWVVAHWGASAASGPESSDAEVIWQIVDDLDPRLSVCECDECGRLWIQTAIGENRYLSFVPEDGVPYDILRTPAQPRTPEPDPER